MINTGFGYNNVAPIGSGRFGFFHIQQRPLPTLSRPASNISIERTDQLVTAHQRLQELYKALEKIKPTFLRSRTRTARDLPASAVSDSSLGIEATETPTTLKSTEEINTTPTSFSPLGPAWVGSTAQATISGEYDGSNGTGTLTFRSERDGTHGSDDLKLKVFNPEGQEIESIDIKKEHPIGQQYTLENGLVLTLGEGDLLKDDTFTVDVVASDPTSFSPSTPEWIGSTALGTLDGVYDGSYGTGTFTFEVEKDGTHGDDDLKIKVFEPGGQELETIEIKKEHPIGQQYTLSNGLVFTLGEGDLLKRTTFTVDVFDSVGTAVDPDNPFNGIGNENARLEYGLGIVDGSFQVNGTTINVYESDTINTVLERITQSNAGVAAAFDPDTETILFTQKTPGSSPDIVFENDTSGFLAAMKLDGAASIPGEDGEEERILAEVEEFSSVQSGSILINGVSISIDVNTDSFIDIIQRINASGAGVTASFSSATKRLTIISEDPQEQLSLDSAGTGFFSAVNISDGTYEPTRGNGNGRGISRRNATQVANAVRDFAEAMNSLFEAPESGSKRDPYLSRIQKRIQSAVSAGFDSTGTEYQTKTGIRFDFGEEVQKVFDFSMSDQRELTDALKSSSGTASIRNLFFGSQSSTKDGLIAKLKETVKQAESSLRAQLGSLGWHVDTWA